MWTTDPKKEFMVKTLEKPFISMLMREFLLSAMPDIQYTVKYSWHI